VNLEVGYFKEVVVTYFEKESWGRHVVSTMFGIRSKSGSKLRKTGCLHLNMKLLHGAA
jgi:hypothetical protein